MKLNINTLTDCNIIIATQIYSTLIGSSINLSIYIIPPTSALKSPAYSEENEKKKTKKKKSHYLVPEIGSASTTGTFLAGKKRSINTISVLITGALRLARAAPGPGTRCAGR